MIYWYVLLWVALFSCLIISFFLSWFMRWHFCLFYSSMLFCQSKSVCATVIYKKKIVELDPQSISNVCFKQIIYGEIYQRNQFAKQWLLILKNKCCNQHSVGLLAYFCGSVQLSKWLMRTKCLFFFFFLLNLCSFHFSLLMVESYPVFAAHAFLLTFPALSETKHRSGTGPGYCLSLLQRLQLQAGELQMFLSDLAALCP